MQKMHPTHLKWPLLQNAETFLEELMLKHYNMSGKITRLTMMMHDGSNLKTGERDG